MKKELEYIDYINITGYIYKITSPSRRIYIGQTTDIEKRTKKYKYLSCKTQPKLYNSLKCHGWNNHKFEIIHECLCGFEKETLNKQEIYWVEKFDSFNSGLNCTKGGSGTLGYKRTDDEKRRISESQKGKIIPIETIKRQRAMLKEGFASGRIINQNKDKPMPQEQKDKLSKNTSFRNLSQESIDKRAATNRGKKRTPLQIENLVNGQKQTFINKKDHKKIEIFNKDHNHVGTFDTPTEVAAYLDTHNIANISACLRGKIKSTKNHFLKYAENEDKTLTPTANFE